MFRKIQVLIIFLIIPLGGLYWYMERNELSLSDFFFPETSVMHIDDIPLHVDVADTPALRQEGLSGRKELGAVDGLLFIFPTSDYHGIWMKDMHFPIDVIWVSEDLEVVGVTEGLQPKSYPKIFEPPQPVKYIVETNTHFAESFGINKGDTVVLPIEYR